ncbi:MAG: hypothetical protein JXP34_23985 [Planctomycetes bacterium]|nr:hypothetical protein [Planctomycetota bacterium]
MVRAENFVVADANGKKRAVLGVTDVGVSLILSDERGEPRVLLGHSSLHGCALLGLFDRDGRELVEVELPGDGGPVIRLKDRTENGGLVIEVHPDGGATLTIRDSEGKTLHEIPRAAPTPLAPQPPSAAGVE